MKAVDCLILILFSVQLAKAEDKPESYFPLTRGNYWIYRGLTKWVEGDSRDNTARIKSQVLTWKMEVADTVECGRVFGALLKGHPSDLCWYKRNQPRGNHLIVRVGTGNYHLFSGDQALQVFQ